MFAYFISLPRYDRVYKWTIWWYTHCSNAARAAGITVLIRELDADEAFTKLLLQAMDEVQVAGNIWLYQLLMIPSEVTAKNIL